MVEVAELLTDSDFCESVTLIRRAESVNEYGENVLVETSATILAAVQPGPGSMLERFPHAAVFKNFIQVYSAVEIVDEAHDRYSDVIVWNGARYQVKGADTFQGSHSEALCVLEAANNG